MQNIEIYGNYLINNEHITTISNKAKANKILVVYFSCTNNTKRVANLINSIIGGDLIEIVPKVPYTSEDIDYGNSESRASKENKNTDILPEISTNINNFDQYETIFLGYPIWFGRAPNIIFNFLKQYNFLNKNIITFCTSASSSDSSKNHIKELAPTANWNDNWKRFPISVQESEVKEWINSLNIPSSILIVYFSATGNTAKIAEYIQKTKLTDIKAIEPVEPYTSSDLNYNDGNSRSSKENSDPDIRPGINDIGSLINYDIIFLGYPIWFGKAPKVLYTFVENNDLSGKIIIPFCTSASSGLGQSATLLESITQNAKYLEGKRFSSSQDENTVVNWVKSLDLSQPDSGDSDNEGIDCLTASSVTGTCCDNNNELHCGKCGTGVNASKCAMCISDDYIFDKLALTCTAEDKTKTEITGVTISGIEQVGQTLTATTTPNYTNYEHIEFIWYYKDESVDSPLSKQPNDAANQYTIQDSDAGHAIVVTVRTKSANDVTISDSFTTDETEVIPTGSISVECPTGCICETSSNICMECEDGYTPKYDVNQAIISCQSCVNGCSKCQGGIPNNCTDCEQQYILRNNMCIFCSFGVESNGKQCKLPCLIEHCLSCFYENGYD